MNKFELGLCSASSSDWDVAQTYAGNTFKFGVGGSDLSLNVTPSRGVGGSQRVYAMRLDIRCSAESVHNKGQNFTFFDEELKGEIGFLVEGTFFKLGNGLNNRINVIRNDYLNQYPNVPENKALIDDNDDLLPSVITHVCGVGDTKLLNSQPFRGSTVSTEKYSPTLGVVGSMDVNCSPRAQKNPGKTVTVHRVSDRFFDHQLVAGVPNVYKGQETYTAWSEDDVLDGEFMEYLPGFSRFQYTLDSSKSDVANTSSHQEGEFYPSASNLKHSSFETDSKNLVNNHCGGEIVYDKVVIKVNDADAQLSVNISNKDSGDLFEGQNLRRGDNDITNKITDINADLDFHLRNGNCGRWKYNFEVWVNNRLYRSYVNGNTISTHCGGVADIKTTLGGAYASDMSPYKSVKLNIRSIDDGLIVYANGKHVGMITTVGTTDITQHVSNHNATLRFDTHNFGCGPWNHDFDIIVDGKVYSNHQRSSSVDTCGVEDSFSTILGKDRFEFPGLEIDTVHINDELIIEVDNGDGYREILKTKSVGKLTLSPAQVYSPDAKLRFKINNSGCFGWGYDFSVHVNGQQIGDYSGGGGTTLCNVRETIDLDLGQLQANSLGFNDRHFSNGKYFPNDGYYCAYPNSYHYGNSECFIISRTNRNLNSRYGSIAAPSNVRSMELTDQNGNTCILNSNKLYQNCGGQDWRWRATKVKFNY